MSKVVDKRKLEGILEQVERADNLAERQQFDEVRELLLAAQADCARAGVDSAFLAWRLCVVFDQLKEHELAFKYAQDALRMDPLAPPFRNSFGVIVGTMRKAILAAQPGAADFVPRFYELLVRAGEGNDAVHVAMARHLQAQGQNERALKLVNAVTVLSPGFRDAWLARAAICRSLGDDQAAREADVEAAAVAEVPRAPFAIPGPATA